MGKILAQLERMASSEYYSDTPPTVTVNPSEDVGFEVSGVVFDPKMYMNEEQKKMYEADMEMYGRDGITTDVLEGEERDITITGGSEAGYKKDIDSFLDNLGKSGLGKGKGPVPVKPVQGLLPPMPGVPTGRSSYRPTESPYGIPSELGTQAEIQQEIARRIAKQLENTIVKRPYLNFRGLA